MFMSPFVYCNTINIKIYLKSILADNLQTEMNMTSTHIHVELETVIVLAGVGPADIGW